MRLDPVSLGKMRRAVRPGIRVPAQSALLNVMTAAARKAARSLKRDFGEVANLQVSLKGPANFVSAADHRAEEILRTELLKARPGYGFLGEEGGTREGTDKTHTWIVDPLDGTTNFLHGIPHFAISIALEREGKIVAGLIYNPANDEIFIAERGKGAFLNDRRIRVAARKRLAEAVVCCALPHHGRGDLALFRREMAAIQDKVAGLRRFGAAALDLAYVAAGRFDVYWERGLSPWDFAAGVVDRARGRRLRHRSGRQRAHAWSRATSSPATRSMHRQVLDLLQGGVTDSDAGPASKAARQAAVLLPLLCHHCGRFMSGRPSADALRRRADRPWREISIPSNCPHPGSSWSG